MAVLLAGCDEVKKMFHTGFTVRDAMTDLQATRYSSGDFSLGRRWGNVLNALV